MIHISISPYSYYYENLKEGEENVSLNDSKKDVMSTEWSKRSEAKKPVECLLGNGPTNHL